MASDPTREELLAEVAIPSEGDRRGQLDVVGIASNRDQMDLVIARSRARAAPRWAELQARLEWKEGSSWIAGVCPHDDYYYAARLYSLLLQGVRARHVVLIGVFHKAGVFDCGDVLVFDSFASWHGPYGPVPVSPLRDDLIRKLPAGDLVVSREMHMVEHSLEALVPFLQAFNPEVEIVPILVPYMTWPTLDRLSANLAGALESVLVEKGWELGKDVAIVCSADAVHYGDAGWGGRSSFPGFAVSWNGAWIRGT